MDCTRECRRAVTLAVLAGGAGTRMGREKATLQIYGNPILSYLMNRLNWPGPRMLVTAPVSITPPGAELFDIGAIDPVEGQGPLRGILTALEHTESDLVAITVDMPGLTPPMLDLLVESIREQPALFGLMYRRIVTSEENVEPFPFYVRASARRVISKALEEGRRSVRGLLQDSRFTTIKAPTEWPATVWTNLNTPADLAAFEKTLAGEDKM